MGEIERARTDRVTELTDLDRATRLHPVTQRTGARPHLARTRTDSLDRPDQHAACQHIEAGHHDDEQAQEHTGHPRRHRVGFGVCGSDRDADRECRDDLAGLSAETAVGAVVRDELGGRRLRSAVTPQARLLHHLSATHEVEGLLAVHVQRSQVPGLELIGLVLGAARIDSALLVVVLVGACVRVAGDPADRIRR